MTGMNDANVDALRWIYGGQDSSAVHEARQKRRSTS